MILIIVDRSREVGNYFHTSEREKTKSGFIRLSPTRRMYNTSAFVTLHAERKRLRHRMNRANSPFAMKRSRRTGRCHHSKSGSMVHRSPEYTRPPIIGTFQRSGAARSSVENNSKRVGCQLVALTACYNTLPKTSRRAPFFRRFSLFYQSIPVISA